MAMWDSYIRPRCAATVGLLRSVSDQEFTTQGVTHMTDKTMMYIYVYNVPILNL